MIFPNFSKTSFCIWGLPGCEIMVPNKRTVVKIASFRFEDDDENEDQVQLLLIVLMLKSVTVMA